MFVQVEVIRLKDVSNAKHHIGVCRSNKKEETEDRQQLCTFNFTVKWDDSGYHIPLLNNYQIQNNGCPWHSCIAEKCTARYDFDLLSF